MDNFIYDNDSSIKSNFDTWYSMNCKERRNYNEPIYELEDAIKVFCSQFYPSHWKQMFESLKTLMRI